MNVPKIFATGLAALLISASSFETDAQSIVLGASDGERFHEGFSLVRGLRELADGRIIVSDWLERRVALVDFTRGIQQDIGKIGAGPNEYRLPSALYPMHGDSTVLVDQGNRRFAVIGPEARINRTFRATEPGGANPGGIDSAGRAYFVIPGWATGAEPDSREPRQLVRWAPGSGRVDVIDRVDSARPRSDAGQPRLTPGIPFVMFAARDGWAVGTDGTVAIVRWNPFRVEWHAPDTEPQIGPELKYDAVPVSAEDRFTFVRQFMDGSPVSGRGEDGGLGLNEPASDQEIRNMVETNEFADAHGPFDPSSLSIAPDGRLWMVRTPPTRRPVVIDVYDRTSGHVGQVVLPANRSLVSVGQQFLYTTSRDDFDVETLERYPIPVFN